MTTTPAAQETELPPPPQPRRMSGRAIFRLLRNLQQKDLTKSLSALPGDTGLVWLRSFGPPVLFVRDPEHVRHLLVSNQDNYVKGNDYRVLAVLLGRGLLTNPDLKDWQRQRKLVQPLFAKRHLAPMADHMTAAATDWLDNVERTTQDGQPLDLHHLMMALTLDVVCRALFGTVIGERTTTTVGSSMDDLLAAAQANLRVAGVYDVVEEQAPRVTFDDLLRLRFRHWGRAQRAKSRMDEIVYGLIDARQREGASERSDLLSLLIAARDDDGSDMDREQVRDEVMTFLGAGHETTANAMTWLWLLLSQHPEARRRMEQEVDDVLQGRVPDAADAERLPWTAACLQEAMRLYPPVAAFTRVAVGPDEVDGIRIEEGTDLVFSPYLLHRNPRLWDNPEGFDPERFMPGADTKGRPRLAFMPFGAGRRICVGQGFAIMEGVLLAAMLTQRLRFDLVPGTQIERDVAITMRPRGGMPMTIHRRRDAPARSTKTEAEPAAA